MDENTQRVREWAAEARSRNKQSPIRLNVDAVLGDLEYLLDRNARLEDDCRLARVMESQANRATRKASEGSAAHWTTIKGMTAQIINAMDALNVAGCLDVSGPLETRIARRIEALTAQRKLRDDNLASVRSLRATARKELAAAEAIIAETHEALNADKVPLDDGRLCTRVKAVIARYPMVRTEGITLKTNPGPGSPFNP